MPSRAMKLRAGFHVSIAGGISNSVDNATAIGCTAFQIFSRNPRGWMAKPLAVDDVKLFSSKLVSSKIARESTVVHMPYLPNLSGPESEFYGKSVDTLAGEVERCSTLGIPHLVIHLGSHLGKGSASGIDQLVKACTTARDKSKQKGSSVSILLENSAGQKNSIGSNFSEIRMILDRLGTKEYGVCVDTCHAFASGYDLRNTTAVDKTLDEFESAVGLKNLKVIHLNDSKGELGANLDRHEHIGLGKIGLAGFRALLSRKEVTALPIIMETPIDSVRKDPDNFRVLVEVSS